MGWAGSAVARVAARGSVHRYRLLERRDLSALHRDPSEPLGLEKDRGAFFGYIQSDNDKPTPNML